jgi:hypothetical protein
MVNRMFHIHPHTQDERRMTHNDVTFL